MRGPEVKTVAISSCIQHCVITDPKSDLNMFQIREREKLEKVIIVQYASSGLSVDLARYALLNLPLKQGDMIRQFIVVRPFDRSLRPPRLISLSTCFSNPTSNEKGGNGTKLQTSSTILKKQENIEREIIEKQHESQLNIDIQHITRLAESRQIDFDTTAEAGNSIKEFAVQAAKDFGATYVMLDSPKKEDQKHVMDNLTCAILTMSRMGRVETLRDPKPEDINPHNTGTSTRMQEELIFDEDICTVCGHKRLMNGGSFTQFSHAELAFSTYGFSHKYVLSKSRKRVYRGTLPSGLQIVVRKHFFATIKEYEFRSLALTLGDVRHENVATLLGFCSEGYHRFLVYEYVCHQSLSTHLSARSKELTWERRLKIALGTCKGLQYLHTNNIYGCLRPKNILLTHDFKPQLANFGLTKNQYEDLNHLSETRVLKTFEYLAPEYCEAGTDSSATDVYSFGVVFLELLTGRKTIEETRGKSFLRWARPLLEEKVYMELIDPLIKDDVNLLQLVLIVRLLEKCLSYDPRERCSISEVVTDLTHIVETGHDHSPI